jgi:AAA domain, putative AbiEii toxin, Type IV TA system/AAA domain
MTYERGMSVAKNRSFVSQEQKSEHYMLKSLRVQNFRCFKEIDLPELRRVNVIVGRNATGKTALLEAVRLAVGGTPGVLWALNQTRSAFFGLQQPLTKEVFEFLWNQYFFDLDGSHPIFTECTDSSGRIATLKLFYDSQKSVTAVPQQPQSQQPQPPNQPISTIAPLAFERTEFSGKSSTLFASVNPQGGLVLDPGPELGMVVEFFPSLLSNNPQQAAQWFSQLSVQKREKEIVDAVRDEFEPALENLSVLSLGPVPAIYASIRYLKERLPLSLLSAGINKFVGLLSAVLNRGGGVVLIDEIENGIFYQRLPSLWKYVLKFASENDVQIFASTHSLECVRALGSAMQGHEGDFTLLRSERTNGSSSVTLLQGKLLEAAIEQGVEIR